MTRHIALVLTLAVAVQTAFASESYQLDNGLKVILEENRASPMVAAMVFVRAGSRFEEPQINGVTHFLEHLLFAGTATRTEAQIEPVIKAFGGYINAFTRKEMTGYLVLMPREFADTGLAVISDMVLNSILPAEQIEPERGIVSEEIRKDTDNMNYQLGKAFDAFRFRGSSYARPVLGELNIIASLTRDEVLEYYQTHYVPQNMSVLIIGDFDPAVMRASVNRYFGGTAPRSRRNLNLSQEVSDVPVSGQHFKTHYLDVPARRLLVSVPTISPGSADFPALELWVDYLNLAGRSPFLHRVSDGNLAVATRASVSLDVRGDGADLSFDLTLNAEADSAQALQAVWEGIADAARNLPGDEEIKALVTSARADEYALLERLHYYGIMRGQRIGVLGWDHVAGRVERMAQVSERDLRRAVSAYRDGCENYFAMYVAPAPDGEPAFKTASADRYAYRQFPNGLTAIVKSNPDSRMFGASIIFKNRSASEPESQAGIVDFAQRLLTYGAGDLSEGDISQQMASLGASVTLSDNPYIPYDDFYTSPQYSFIKFSALDDRAPKALALLHTMISEPQFDSASTERVRSKIMGVFGMQSQSASKAAKRLYHDDLFSYGPMAANVSGSATSIGRISAADLKNFWAEYASPANTVIAIATGAEPEVAMSWIAETFGAAPSVEPPQLVTQSAPLSPDSIRTLHVPMDKAQLQIYMGRPVCGPADEDAAALRIMTRILSDRLAANLREKQGLAYSVGASIEFTPDYGWITCRIGTASENYSRALTGLKGEMKRLTLEPPGADELNGARNQMRGRALMRRLARENQCYYMALGEFLGGGYDYDDRLGSALESVTVGDIRRVAETYLTSERMIIVSAGKLPDGVSVSNRR